MLVRCTETRTSSKGGPTPTIGHTIKTAGVAPTVRIRELNNFVQSTSESRQIPAGVGPCCKTTYSHPPWAILAAALLAPFR